MIELVPAIQSLFKQEVEFVILGGVAIGFHGSGYVTQDLDFCYRRNKENLKKIVSALGQYKPRPRGFPEDLPYIFDEVTCKMPRILPLKRRLEILICLEKLPELVII